VIISWSTWEQAQYNLVQDFIDLLYPPAYAYAIETKFLKTTRIEGLIEDRFNSLELPETKLVRLEQLLKEAPTLEEFPRGARDWATLFTFNLLEGFGQGAASNLQAAAFEGLKQFASTWGLYLAHEMERAFHRYELFTAFSDFVAEVAIRMLFQTPAKELGDVFRESMTPAYLRASETVVYELALFNNNQARMRVSQGFLQASDAELEREIDNIFTGYSGVQLGRQIQRMVAVVTSRLKKLFSNDRFRDEFHKNLSTAGLITYRYISWYIGYRLHRNLQCNPEKTNGLLEAIGHHKEIMAVMEQYRYGYSWDGDRTKAIRLGWLAVAPRYFHLSGKVESITKDETEEKLIGVAQGLEDYTDKNPAIDALKDGFLGKLGAYLMKAAKNEETDYVRKQMSDGNIALTKARHASDLRNPDEEADGELSDDEILSREKEKHYPSRDSVVEELESKETIEEWYKSLTESEKTATNLKSADYTEAKIADMMGISQQRVSQLLQQSLRKYKKLKIH